MSLIPMTSFEKKLISIKIVAALMVLLIAVLSCTSVIDLLFAQKPVRMLDEKGDKYFDETMTRSLSTFAVARSLNALISVVQGTTLAVSPAGVGVSLTVGEILDPVNDLMERFSWIMLLSSTSLGIQKILMEIGVWFAFKVLLSFSMFLIFIGIWIPRIAQIDLKRFGYRLIWLSLILRFCIPAVAIVSEGVYDLFLKQKYADSIESLERVKQAVRDISLIPEEGQPGFLDGFFDMLTGKQQHVGLKDRITMLKNKIADYAENTINLIIVFLVQTVLIPLGVFWVMMRSVRWISRF